MSWFGDISFLKICLAIKLLSKRAFVIKSSAWLVSMLYQPQNASISTEPSKWKAVKTAENSRQEEAAGKNVCPIRDPLQTYWAENEGQGQMEFPLHLPVVPSYCLLGGGGGGKATKLCLPFLPSYHHCKCPQLGLSLLRTHWLQLTSLCFPGKPNAFSLG